MALPLVTLLLLTACSTTNHQRLTSREYFSQFRNLAEALRYYPSLLIKGTGNQTKVIVRKNSSVQNPEPLYVVDGYPVGNSYASANQIVNMSDVVNIKLLTHSYELNTYGTNAAAGVIEIRTIRSTANTN